MNYYNAITLEYCSLTDTTVSQKLENFFKSEGRTKGKQFCEKV